MSAQEKLVFIQTSFSTERRVLYQLFLNLLGSAELELPDVSHFIEHSYYITLLIASQFISGISIFCTSQSNAVQMRAKGSREPLPTPSFFCTSICLQMPNTNWVFSSSAQCGMQRTNRSSLDSSLDKQMIRFQTQTENLCWVLPEASAEPLTAFFCESCPALAPFSQLYPPQTET